MSRAICAKANHKPLPDLGGPRLRVLFVGGFTLGGCAPSRTPSSRATASA